MCAARYGFGIQPAPQHGLSFSREHPYPGAYLWGEGELRTPAEIKSWVFGAPTSRQIEILQLMADGSSIAEVAEILWLAVETVRNHVKRLHIRLGVHSSTACVAALFRMGLIR